jgi:hypothetical protein
LPFTIEDDDETVEDGEIEDIDDISEDVSDDRLMMGEVLTVFMVSVS